MKVKRIARTILENDFSWELDKQLFDDDSYYHSADALVEYAARKCYSSTSKMFSKPTFVQDVLAKGHLTVAEHIAFTFEVDDISVACLGQLVRHGLMSHSVESTRFVDQSTTEFVYPEGFDKLDSELFDAVIDHNDNALELYRKLRDAGICKGDARYVLPTGMVTGLILSGNGSMWRNFLVQRCDKAAQTEIRMLALKILKLLVEVAPATFEDIYMKYFEECNAQ